MEDIFLEAEPRQEVGKGKIIVSGITLLTILRTGRKRNSFYIA